MLKLHLSRRTYYGAPEDAHAIETIKARYGCSTDSDAVRLALRLLAESPPVHLPARKKSSKTG